MILYHGSNVFIEQVNLQKCRPFKDFGRGFYCTEIKEQAEQMAKRVAFIYGGSPCVTVCKLNEEVTGFTVGFLCWGGEKRINIRREICLCP